MLGALIVFVIVLVPGLIYVVLSQRADLRNPEKREQTLRTMQTLDLVGRGADKVTRAAVGTALPAVGAYRLVKRGRRKRDERLAEMIAAEQARILNKRHD